MQKYLTTIFYILKKIPKFWGNICFLKNKVKTFIKFLITSSFICFFILTLEISANKSNYEVDLKQAQIPQITLEKDRIKTQIKKGVSLISFPFLAESEKNILDKNKHITQVWQNNTNEKPVINNKETYFIKSAEDTEITWKKSNIGHSSQFLEFGTNFINIDQDLSPLALNKIKINGESIFTILTSNNVLLNAFYFFDQNGKLHNLIEDKKFGLTLAPGSGVIIESKGFAKISWPVSETINNSKSTKKIVSEKEKYIKKVEQKIEKYEAQKSSQIFKEIKDLPLQFLEKLYDNNFLKEFIADEELLSEIYSEQLLNLNKNIFKIDFWQNKPELQRIKVAILKNKNLQTLNTANQGLIFLEFPYEIEEIDPSSGKESFFFPFIFLRKENCTWQFNPIATNELFNFISRQNNIYTETHLSKLLESQLSFPKESIEFKQNREHCLETETKKGKFIKIEREKPVKSDTTKTENNNTISPKEKLIKKQCKIFKKIIDKINPTQKEFIFLKEKESLNGKLPQIAFYPDICENYWTKILIQENYLDIINESSDSEQVNWIQEDSFYIFLGIDTSFDCTEIEDSQKQEYCYLGKAFKKKSGAFCKEINSEKPQAFCTAYTAQSKRNDLVCNQVFGEKEKKTSEKIKNKIDNCLMQVVISKHKDKKDCKKLKKRFLFFFSRSNNYYEYCLEVVEKKLHKKTEKADLSKQKLLELMGIEE